jgi:hypothetical protein
MAYKALRAAKYTSTQAHIQSENGRIMSGAARLMDVMNKAKQQIGTSKEGMAT